VSNEGVKWATDKLTWLALGAAAGITFQKSVPLDDMACPIVLFIFMCSCSINASLPGE
jgi:hypothetical protein